MNLTRSEFLKLMAGVAGSALIPQAQANPWGLPLGIQLYTVRNDLKADFPGTLSKLVAMGYKEVEAGFTDEGTIDFNGGAPPKFKKMLDDAGLRVPSAHFPVPDNDDAVGQEHRARAPAQA